MNSLSSVEIELFALPMIFVGIALLLSHFFEDSDRFRGFCEKLRAKYILTHKGPLEYLNNITSEEKRELQKEKVKILEEYIFFRGVTIHYGIVLTMVFIGFGLIVAIFFHIALEFNEITCILFPFLFLGFFCFFLQLVYMEQDAATGRRINKLKTYKFKDQKIFEDHCKSLIITEEPEEPHDIIFNLSKFWLWVWSTERKGWKPLLL